MRRLALCLLVWPQASFLTRRHDEILLMLLSMEVAWLKSLLALSSTDWLLHLMVRPLAAAVLIDLRVWRMIRLYWSVLLRKSFPATMIVRSELILRLTCSNASFLTSIDLLEIVDVMSRRLAPNQVWWWMRSLVQLALIDWSANDASFLQVLVTLITWVVLVLLILIWSHCELIWTFRLNFSKLYID